MTVVVACGIGPVVVACALFLLEGGKVSQLYMVSSQGGIPMWFVAPQFVLPATLPTAILLCLWMRYVSVRMKRSSNLMKRLVCVISCVIYGAVFPFIMTIGGTHESFTNRSFVVNHWIACVGGGVVFGFILNRIWFSYEGRGILRGQP
jgi:hypothetical protein